MEQYQVFWAALQQAVWIAFGPSILLIAGGIIAATIAVSAWELGAALFHKYIG